LVVHGLEQVRLDDEHLGPVAGDSGCQLLDELGAVGPAALVPGCAVRSAEVVDEDVVVRHADVLLRLADDLFEAGDGDAPVGRVVRRRFDVDGGQRAVVVQVQEVRHFAGAVVAEQPVLAELVDDPGEQRRGTVRGDRVVQGLVRSWLFPCDLEAAEVIELQVRKRRAYQVATRDAAPAERMSGLVVDGQQVAVLDRRP
jgi:hypothetical protein